MVAYGKAELVWKATDHVSDELAITKVDGMLLEVEGLNAATRLTVQLTIDVRTGDLIGD